MNVHSFFVVYCNMNTKVKDKHEAILQTTLDLISERGFHNTPMSLIAKEAKVATGTIYRYFKNKEDLINKLFLEWKKRMDEATFEGYDKALPIKVQFQLVWKNVLNFYIQNPKAFKFIEQYYYSPFISDETRNESAKFHNPITQFFEEFQKTNIIKPLPIDALFALVHGPIVSLAQFNLQSKTVLSKQELNDVIETVWEAITI